MNIREQRSTAREGAISQLRDVRSVDEFLSLPLSDELDSPMIQSAGFSFHVADLVLQVDAIEHYPADSGSGLVFADGTSCAEREGRYQRSIAVVGREGQAAVFELL